MAEIRVIRMRVMEEPEVAIIPSGLDSLSAEVGGRIDMVELGRGVDAIVNDEGILESLPFNRVLPTPYGGVPVVGDIVIAAHDGEGETISLSDAQIAEWLPKLQRSSHFLN